MSNMDADYPVAVFIGVLTTARDLYRRRLSFCYSGLSDTYVLRFPTADLTS